jgi:hypothetical protein
MVRLLSEAFIRDGAAAEWKRVPPGLEWSAFVMASAAFALGFAARFFQSLLQGLTWLGGAP